VATVVTVTVVTVVLTTTQAFSKFMFAPFSGSAIRGKRNRRINYVCQSTVSELFFIRSELSHESRLLDGCRFIFSCGTCGLSERDLTQCENVFRDELLL
jgi:hypothetical protein